MKYTFLPVSKLQRLFELETWKKFVNKVESKKYLAILTELNKRSLNGTDGFYNSVI